MEAKQQNVQDFFAGGSLCFVLGLCVWFFLIIII